MFTILHRLFRGIDRLADCDRVRHENNSSARKTERETTLRVQVLYLWKISRSRRKTLPRFACKLAKRFVRSNRFFSLARKIVSSPSQFYTIGEPIAPRRRSFALPFSSHDTMSCLPMKYALISIRGPHVNVYRRLSVIGCREGVSRATTPSLSLSLGEGIFFLPPPWLSHFPFGFRFLSFIPLVETALCSRANR